MLTVLLVVAAFVPISASAAQSPETPEPCVGIEGPQLVAFFETGEPLDDGMLYPGTMLTLYVCEDGGAESYGAAWQFDESAVPGLRILENTDTHLVVSVTNRSEATNPASAVEQKPEIKGPKIRIQTGHTATQRINETAVTLRFASQADRNAFNRSATQFRSNASAAAEASANLSARKGEALLTDPSEPLSTVKSADGSHLERTAFEASAVTGVKAVAETVQLVDNREAAVQASVREDLQAYLSTLEAREQEAVNTVRLTLGGTLFGGLVVGGALGYWLSRRTLRKVEADRGVSTATQYSWKHIGLPLTIGALVLVATLIVLTLHWGTLFEVVL